MNSKQTKRNIERIKIEGDVQGTRIIIRAIGVDSGCTHRILCDITAESIETVDAEFAGAMKFLKAYMQQNPV